MDRDEWDLRRHGGSCVSGAARMARRQLLATMALAAIGLSCSRRAAAQRVADCGAADDPDASLPYRDLRRGVACASRLNPLGEADSTRVRRVRIEYFFAYDCATCFALDTELIAWQRTLPRNTQLVRVPATYSALERLHAQAFYTATRLGKVDQLHTALYEALQRDGQRLDTTPALAMLFESSGVDRGVFSSEFNSVEVHIGVYRAEHQSRRYGVTRVPALVIGGRYLTTPEIAGSNEAMLAAAVERVSALGRQR